MGELRILALSLTPLCLVELICIIFQFHCDLTSGCKRRLVKYYAICPARVLIFCVEFRDLSHLTRDLSQVEKKINVVAR